MDQETGAIIFAASFVIVFFCVPAVVGYKVARERGRNPIGWTILSAFFPPVPIIVLYMIKPAKVVPGKTIRCPYCQEITFAKVMICEVCQKELHLRQDHPLMTTTAAAETAKVAATN